MTDTTEPATNPKRARIDPQAFLAPSTDRVTGTPMKAAIESIDLFVASLTSSGLTKLAQQVSTELLALLAKRFGKEKQKHRMTENPDLIPNSIRFKFALTGSNEVKNSTRFSQLQTECDAIIHQAQLQLKQKIISTTDLEIEQMNLQIEQKLCSSIHTLATAFLIADHLDMNDAHKVANEILRAQHTALWSHLTPNIDMNTAITKYCHHLQLETIPHFSIGTRFEKTDHYFRKIERCLIHPFTIYKNTHQQNQADLQLKKLNLTVARTNITEATAMAVDSTPTLSEQTIQDLIQSNVKKALAKQQAKNETRGQRNKRSASKQKQEANSTSQQPKRNQNKQNQSKPTPPQKSSGKKKKGNDRAVENNKDGKQNNRSKTASKKPSSSRNNNKNNNTRTSPGRSRKGL